MKHLVFKMSGFGGLVVPEQVVAESIDEDGRMWAVTPGATGDWWHERRVGVDGELFGDKSACLVRCRELNQQGRRHVLVGV